MKIVIYLFLILCAMTASKLVSASNEIKTIWKMSLVKNAEFPWWDEIRYPTEINLAKNGPYFIDQYGSKCVPPVFFYDAQSKYYVFKSCGIKKSDQAFEPFFRAKQTGNNLLIEVWTFRQLFILKSK